MAFLKNLTENESPVFVQGVIMLKISVSSKVNASTDPSYSLRKQRAMEKKNR